jgi:hypothetical protein
MNRTEQEWKKMRKEINPTTAAAAPLNHCYENIPPSLSAALVVFYRPVQPSRQQQQLTILIVNLRAS